MKKGKIIFLNGTSSSGKTTIANALHEKLPDPYMKISIDDFLSKLPSQFWTAKTQEEANSKQKLLISIISGFHKSIATLGYSGINLLVDHVFQEKEWFEECVREWDGLDVFFVGIKCPLEIVEQREKERGDRELGTARYQYDRIHSYGGYDVEVDTSIMTVENCVAVILDKVKDFPKTPIWSTFG